MKDTPRHQQIGEAMANAYRDTLTRIQATNVVRAKFDELSFEDAEMIWYALDAYLDQQPANPPA